MAEAARATLDSLMARRDEVRHRIGTDDPYVLATVMKDFLTSRYYADRGNRLEGVRLMPLDRRLIREADLEFNQFPQIFFGLLEVKRWAIRESGADIVVQSL